MSEFYYQEGVTMQFRNNAIFMEINFKTEDEEAIRHAIGKVVGQTKSFQTRYQDSGIGVVIGFGLDAWRMLGESNSAPELKNYRELGYGLSKATQSDMVIHILSFDHAINYTYAMGVCDILRDVAAVEEETHGFRWLEARDFSGFVEGTANAKGEAMRRDVAVINEGVDRGGSYMVAMKWVHSLDQFNHFDEQGQNEVFGRTKHTDIELDEMPESSHIARVEIDGDDGEELEIVRQGLPYGKASGEHGLYFLAYSAELTRFEQMLDRMFGEQDDIFDRILSYSKAVRGNYCYVPSIEQLEAIGGH